MTRLRLDYPLSATFFLLAVFIHVCLVWTQRERDALRRELSYVQMQRDLYQDRANRLENVVTTLRNEEGR